MFIITQNGTITLTRGDSAEFIVELNVGTTLNQKSIILEPTDKVYFGVTEPNQPFENAIIRKTFKGEDHLDETNLVIYLEPKDTCCLIPGTYYYSVKVVSENNFVKSVVDKKIFNIID